MGTNQMQQGGCGSEMPGGEGGKWCKKIGMWELEKGGEG